MSISNVIIIIIAEHFDDSHTKIGHLLWTQRATLPHSLSMGKKNHPLSLTFYGQKEPPSLTHFLWAQRATISHILWSQRATLSHSLSMGKKSHHLSLTFYGHKEPPSLTFYGHTEPPSLTHFL